MSKQETVYVLANRANNIFMHWFLYLISGLYDLKHLPKPIKFHTVVTLDFQRETLPLLKPDFEFVENTDGYTIVKYEGAPCKTIYTVEDHYYHFVRNQILVKNHLERTEKPFRRIYISRSKSHLVTYPIGAKRRQLVNEHILTDMLKEYGFECIHLEDYSMLDKIRLFQEASIIITPNGGALACAYFASKDTKIVSITCPNPAELHYAHLCNILSIPFYFYNKVKCYDAKGEPFTPKYMSDEFTMELTDYNNFLEAIKSIVPLSKDTPSQSNKMVPPLTLCIPTMNRWSFLEHNLAEYLKNPYIDDIVICDENGNDAAMIRQRFPDPKIRLYVNDRCLGPYLNKRKAVALAKNKFVCLMDSDNFAPLSYFEAWEAFLGGKEPNEQVIYSPYRTIPQANHEGFDYSVFKNVYITNKNYKYYWKNIPGATCLYNTGNYIVPKSLFLASDTDPELKFIEEQKSTDVMFQNYFIWKNSGGMMVAVPGMDYHHIVHNGSYYIQHCAEMNTKLLDSLYD
jgi:hypothetical protein